jgi:hypothetical protein
MTIRFAGGFKGSRRRKEAGTLETMFYCNQEACSGSARLFPSAATGLDTLLPFAWLAPK